MAWTDWVPIDDTAYMTTNYITQIYGNQMVVHDLLLEQGYTITGFILLSANMSTVPYPEFMNQVENNIRELYNALGLSLPNRPQTIRTWLGEYDDNPLFCFADVNRWFNDIANLREILTSIILQTRILGTFTAGRSHQTIRRG